MNRHPAVVACEEFLRAERDYNAEHEILRSENEVVERLLSRRMELIDAYVDIHRRLDGTSHPVGNLLRVVVTTAAFWAPDDALRLRDERDRLSVVNERIAATSTELAKLLRERSRLHDLGGFACDTHYHVLRVVEDAASDNHLFGSWVRDELAALRGRFDLKYWPRLHEFASALAEDAAEAVVAPSDPVTRAATRSRRPSRADFFRALIEAIEEVCDGVVGGLPRSFGLGDETLATLGNCALDLPCEEMVDGAYVKRLRQRDREASST